MGNEECCRGTELNGRSPELVFGKEVMLETHGLDKYKRTIADVLLPDGMNLNQKLVRQGRGESMFWELRNKVKETIQFPRGTAALYP